MSCASLFTASGIREGTIVPGAPIRVVKEEGATAVLDCGGNFGQVGGRRATEVALAKAREHKVACVVTVNCRHVGRLGYFTEMASRAGFFAFASVNSAPAGHAVVPFGGLAGRLSPNPLSYGAPGLDHPIVADMTMSTTAQGKVVICRNKGQQAPEGWMIDAQGHPTTDPDVLFQKPRGWILPMGGNVGYKGTALLLMAEILSGALGGVSITDPVLDGTNGLCLIVIDVSAFVPLEQFRAEMAVITDYIKSAPPAPGFDEVLMPGEIDERIKADREANGIPVDPVTWQSIRETAESLGISVVEPVPAGQV